MRAPGPGSGEHSSDVGAARHRFIARRKIPTLDPRGAGQFFEGQTIAFPRLRPPVESTTSKRLYRLISRCVCPWNVKFSQELADNSAFRTREFVVGKESQTLATDILSLDQDAFSAALKQSPMKRAKLAGLQRNAAVVLRNVGMVDDSHCSRRGHSKGPSCADPLAGTGMLSAQPESRSPLRRRPTPPRAAYKRRMPLPPTPRSRVESAPRSTGSGRAAGRAQRAARGSGHRQA